MNLAAMLQRSAHCFPDSPAIGRGLEVVRTYAELAERVARLSASLRASLAPGDRVMLVSENSADYLEILFGIWHAGMVAVPVNAKLHRKEIAYLLQSSGARWMFCSPHLEWRIEELERSERMQLERSFVIGETDDYLSLFRAAPAAGPHPAGLEDPAWIFYTSGTTGRPKGAILTHGNLRAMCHAFLCDVEPIEPGDSMVHLAPLSHGSGLYALPHVLKAAANVVPASGGFHVEEADLLLDAWRHCCTFGTPTMINRIVRAGRPPGHPRPVYRGLKSVIFAGSPLYVEDCKAAYEWFDGRVAQIYGQGETPCTITVLSRAMYADAFRRNDLARIASVGVAQTGIEFEIDGRPSGEVLVRGPTVMQGYWQNPEATAETLAEGWLHTGDIGSVSAQGFLTLLDRSNDSIISGGSNIYPREVEEVLLKHPSLAEVSVVGRRHPDWGEEVVACVVLREPRSGTNGIERELDELCLSNIARFKRPKAYLFLEELPKSAYGKILKQVLRQQLDRARGMTNQ